MSLEEIAALHTRTQQWHAWDHAQPGRLPNPILESQTDLTNYDPCCPLLVNGHCSIYPVRPVICRIHYVSSPPLRCQGINDPQLNQDTPVVLKTISKVATPFMDTLQAYIEATDADYLRSQKLLPHGLANKMGWDFAVTT